MSNAQTLKLRERTPVTDVAIGTSTATIRTAPGTALPPWRAATD